MSRGANDSPSRTSTPSEQRVSLDFLDTLKALALLGVLLNHFSEEFGPGPWFTNPTDNWPDLATRLHHLFPQGHTFIVNLLFFLGWLGDSCPGVFILASGLGLTWSMLARPAGPFQPLSFYRRRLLKIFPLYIAMHLVVIAGSTLFRAQEVSFASPKVLLSLLGLRFFDDVFFYINPSWWFVWLILQLYLLFPFLYWLLERTSLTRFALLTFGLTFASRGLGLAGIRYSDSLYYWMTGIFCGTRLAEFTAGMIIATWLWSRKKGALPLPSGRQILPWALLSYLAGWASSLTLAGSIVANLLVTLGLCGLFFSAWDMGVKHSVRLSRMVGWLGLISYSVYLLHQAPLQWVNALLGTHPLLHVLAAVLGLILSFPLAWLMERFVERAIALLQGPSRRRLFSVLSRVAFVGTALVLVFIEPALSYGRYYKILAFLLVLGLLYGLMRELSPLPAVRQEDRLWRWSLMASAFLCLFVLPENAFALSLIIGVIVALFALGFSTIIKRVWNAWLAATLATLVLLIAVELLLGWLKPLEAGQWGELPALQIHSTRVYALKPNLSLRLRYNNYQYLLQTNSLGLPGPEIVPAVAGARPRRVLITGDAFTMPEAIEYPHAYPALLEQALRKRTPAIQVIDAGVTGYGPVEVQAQLQELVPLLKPELVIYQYFINEFEEIDFTARARRQGIGLLPSDEPLRRRLLTHSQLASHWKQLFWRLEEILTGRPNPARDERALLAFYRRGDTPLYTPARREKMRRFFTTLRDLTQAHRARLLVLFVPGAVEATPPQHLNYLPRDLDLPHSTTYDLNRPFHELQQIAAPLGLTVVDLRPVLREGRPCYFPDSWHWNARGHQVVGSHLAQIIGPGL